MRKLSIVKLGSFIDDTPPESDTKALQAIHCWNFCGGWNPERLPIYDAIYGIEDWEQMADLLIAIRDRPSGNQS